MYSQYFGLTEKPFAIAPNPRYLYMSELHREALAHLVYGINSDGCFVLLSGNVGTGKTTICRCLLEQLPQNTDIALILNPLLTTSELLKTICEELGIEAAARSDSAKAYIDELNRYLLQSHANGRRTALIIDEAQNLDLEVLEQLRLLTNLETNTHKLLKIILIGQPELRSLLEQPDLSQLNQRITSRYHLPSLQPQDVKAYIQHRISIAGGGRLQLFSDKAIKHLIKISNGIPRVINLLCDRALLGAYSENEDHVTLKIMKKAGLEVFPNNDQQSIFSKMKIMEIGVVVLLIGLLIIFFPVISRKYPITGDMEKQLDDNPHLQQESPSKPSQTITRSLESEDVVPLLPVTNNKPDSLPTTSPKTTSSINIDHNITVEFDRQ